MLLKIKINNLLRKIYNKTIRKYQIYTVNKKTKNKVNKKLIAFECFFGRSILDNPKAIYDALDKAKYQCIFIVNDPKKFLEYQTVKRNSKEHYTLLRQAKIIVSNQRMPEYWLKQDQQIFIQTWHGTPLKKLVHDLTTYHMPSAGSLDDYVEMFDKDVKRWDYLYSSCDYATEKFKSAFNYQQEILQIGYPRNELLYKYNKANIKAIKQKLNIPNDKKVILYAPTYRDNLNEGLGKYSFETTLDFQKIKQAFPDYIILLRYHYIITKSKDFKNPNIINVTQYNDINELYIVSDILITDYSSVFFDYSILKRPFFFFAQDVNEYKNKLRGFYLDYEKDLVTKPTNSTDQIIQLIKEQNKYDFTTFSEKYNPKTNQDCLEKTIQLIDNLTK
ncbi:CDP-glycerol glycerophosphotransferase family protein [Mycoplasma sp. P36-A1]|uniref:CDP-glycerol glycerophosphotransferase family protein n=1 Tax=Mycoplasma sp. P36-A1 TaxID=3252900 RepID=UPI003C30A7D4